MNRTALPTLRDLRQAAQAFAIGVIILVGWQLTIGRNRGSPTSVLILAGVTISAWARSRYSVHGTAAPPRARIITGVIVGALSTFAAFVMQPLYRWPLHRWDAVLIVAFSLVVAWWLLGRTWPTPEVRRSSTPSTP